MSTSSNARRRVLRSIGSSCEGKRKFSSLRDAEESAVRLEPTLGYMEGYSCAWCSGFHIGHPARYGKENAK